ncbi:hypothetical protein PENTCL1PPCAC_15127, partial [Pristionchus entomophagus]
VDPRTRGDLLALNLNISCGHSHNIRYEDVAVSLQLQTAGARVWHLNLVRNLGNSILANHSVHLGAHFILNHGVFGEQEHGPSQR